MYTTAAVDVTLSPSDAVKVLEELLEAQNHSRFLGFKLNVPDYMVTSIHTQYTDPKDCLYSVLVEFLKQVEPRPTWRAIVDALRSPVVNLPHLARTVEAAHFPDPTLAHDVAHFPDPTSIVDALRSPVVNLPHLAGTVEAAHFPDPTLTRDVAYFPDPTSTTSTGISVPPSVALIL